MSFQIKNSLVNPQKNQNSTPTKKKKTPHSINAMSAGAAGVMSALIGHPFDRIKTAAHLSDPPKRVWTITNNIYKANGAKGFLDGIGASVISTGAHRMAKFMAHDHFKGAFDDSIKNESIKLGLSGFYAGAIQGCVATPLEAVKIQSMKSTQNSWTSLKTIYKNHGLKGFQKGLDACIARDAIWTMIYFPALNFLDKQVAYYRNENTPSETTRVFTGAISGMIGSLANCPIDVAKSRIQAGQIDSKNVIEAICEIGIKNGLKGLYAGLPLKFLQMAPAGAAMWFVNNAVKDFLQQNSLQE